MTFVVHNNGTVTSSHDHLTPTEWMEELRKQRRREARARKSRPRNDKKKK
jgi:hypothetical protein